MTLQKSLTNAFQFHKGTIKTLLTNLLINFVFYFNSIKVQLKPQLVLCDNHQQLYFNSIKVQLKRVALPLTRMTSRFQFHKGTIKTSDSRS